MYPANKAFCGIKVLHDIHLPTKHVVVRFPSPAALTPRSKPLHCVQKLTRHMVVQTDGTFRADEYYV